MLERTGGAGRTDFGAVVTSTPRWSESAASGYDFATDTRLSFEERFYLITDADPVSQPGSNLELSADARFGPRQATLLVERGRLACDGARAGLSPSKNVDKTVEYGGLTVMRHGWC